MKKARTRGPFPYTTAVSGHLPGHVLAQLELADRRAVHLVRTVGQAQGALHGVPVGQREVVGNPGATVHLDRPVDHLQRHVGRHHLDLGDFALGDLVAHGIHHVGGLQGQQACHVDLHPRVGDVVDVAAQARQRLAERGTADRALAHQFEGALGHADGAHAVVDAARAEAPLGDLETAALAEDDVLVGHPHVLEQHFGMAMRRVVVAEHRQRTEDLHPGGVDRYQDHRVLLVARRVRVGQAHEDQDLAARIAGAGSPPLAPVDHPVVALALGARLHIGGVGRGHARFGHGEGRADLAAQQRFQPGALLLLAAVAHQHLHVAGIRRGAVEGFRPDQRTAHDFRQRRVFVVGQPGTILGLGQEQVPQPFGLGLGLQLFHDRRRLPAVALGDLALEHGLGGIDMRFHERADTFTQLLDLGGIGEIHGGYLLTGWQARHRTKALVTMPEQGLRFAQSIFSVHEHS